MTQAHRGGGRHDTEKRETIRATCCREAERALAAWRVSWCGRAVATDNLPLDDLYRLQRACCYLCGHPFEGKRGLHRLSITREHVFPRAQGGGGAANILLAHKACNEAKGDRWPTPCEVIYLAAVYVQ